MFFHAQVLRRVVTIQLSKLIDLSQEQQHASNIVLQGAKQLLVAHNALPKFT